MPPKPTPADQIRTWISTGDDVDNPTPTLAKTWRIAAGLTARDAAAAVGVVERTLIRWETGDGMPQGTNLANYHRFLDRLRKQQEDQQ